MASEPESAGDLAARCERLEERVAELELTLLLVNECLDQFTALGEAFLSVGYFGERVGAAIQRLDAKVKRLEQAPIAPSPEP
jgi:hypothetical protein